MNDVTAGMLLALFSAFATAGSHAMLKSARDKLAVRTHISLFAFVVALPFAVWSGVPSPELWSWLIAAALLHATYQFVVIWSYSVSDFSVAFPLARGSAPLLAALMGAGLLGESLGAAAILGICTVSAGILLLTASQGISRSGIVAALVAGMLTAAYTIVDAAGVRSAPQAIAFISWFFVLDMIAMPSLFLLTRRRSAPALFIREARTGVMAGAVTLLSFGAALFALGLAPVGTVSALRETSVLIGLVMASTMLKEKLGVRRIAGALLIVAGAVATFVGTANE